jgi:hypothetical protein
MKAANSDAFKVAVNRLCNVADDVYRKQYLDKTLDEWQYDKIVEVMKNLKDDDQANVQAALESGKINKDNYDKVLSKLKGSK